MPLSPFERATNMLALSKERGIEIGRLKPTIVPIRNGDMIGIYCPKTYKGQARLIFEEQASGIMIGLCDIRPVDDTTEEPADEPIKVFGITNGGRWAPARSPEGVDILYGHLKPSDEIELWGQVAERDPVQIPADPETVAIFADVCMNALGRRFGAPAV